jgi:hypothetical protein
LVLVFGILGVVGVSLFAPFAWYFGSKALTEIDASPDAFSNRGSVVAGRVLGIVGTVVLGLALLFVIALVGLAASGLGAAGLGPSLQTDPQLLVFLGAVFAVLMFVGWNLAD